MTPGTLENFVKATRGEAAAFLKAAFQTPLPGESKLRSSTPEQLDPAARTGTAGQE
jgi:hypothetical protein